MDEDQKTWPSRDSILDMCVACAEKHGLEDKAKLLGLKSSGQSDEHLRFQAQPALVLDRIYTD